MSRSSGPYRLLLIAAMLLSAFCTPAQDGEEYYYEDFDDEIEYSDEEYKEPRRTDRVDHDAETYSTSTFVPAKADSTSWDEIVGEQRYLEVDPEPKDVDEKEKEQSKGSTPLWGGWKYVILVLILAVLIVVLVKVMSQSGTDNIKVTALEINTLEEAEVDLQRADLSALLARAIEAGDLRLALRLRYLMVLKRLDETGRIDYHISKTSMDYLVALSGTIERDGFSRLSRINDYVWYAEVPISKTDHDRFAHSFSDYMMRIDG